MKIPGCPYSRVPIFKKNVCVSGEYKNRHHPVAAAIADGIFRRRVFFVNLDTVKKPELVAATVTQIFGIKETSEKTVYETPADSLTGQRLLLIASRRRISALNRSASRSNQQSAAFMILTFRSRAF